MYTNSTSLTKSKNHVVYNTGFKFFLDILSQQENKSMLICDIDDQNTKYVIAI